MIEPILKVDWVPDLGGPGSQEQGALGLCRLPGFLGSPLQDDLARLKQAGVELLVSLVEDGELRLFGDSDLVPKVEGSGLRSRRFPIRDGSVPGEGPKALQPLIEELAQELQAGRKLAIHCLAGKGRSGLVAGCLLVELGKQPSEAIALLQRARGADCPETPAQRWFIEAYARELHSASSVTAASGSAPGLAGLSRS